MRIHVVSTEGTLLIDPQTLPSEPKTVTEVLNDTRRILYFSHLIAKFSEICWQFCLILFFMALTDYKSIILVSTYGMFNGIVICFSAPLTGRYIDSGDRSRLHIARVFITVQNLSVILASVSCCILLRMAHYAQLNENPLKNSNDGYFSNLFSAVTTPLTWKACILLISIHILGAVARVMDQAMTVAMERDWIVEMSKLAGYDDDTIIKTDLDNLNAESYTNGGSIAANGGSISENFGSIAANGGSLAASSISFGSDVVVDSTMIRRLKISTWLSQTNTSMKQIDLLCKVSAPAAAGIFFSFFDSANTSEGAHFLNLSYAAMIISVANLVSLYVEYTCTTDIYKFIPTLSRRMTKENSLNSIQQMDLGEIEETEKDGTMCDFFSVPEGIKVYFRQPIWPGGIAMALLYLNVLTFGALMTAYLVWKGLSFDQIGIWRGLSSLIGLAGTFLFRLSTRRYGVAGTGMWSISFQFCCLTLCVISIYIQNDAFSIALLIFGVCTSRIGLWVFDLTITLFMQNHIPENVRGLVGGMQKSMNGFLELTTYLLGFLFSDPNDFYIIVFAGYCSVGLGLVSYFLGIYRRRHDFPIETGGKR